MNILNIDSTTGRLSIVVSRNSGIVSSHSRESGQKHMEMIIEDIHSTLKKAGMAIVDIDAFGVNKGPGDFTGTRIGISVVKTFGWVLDRPVYGINGLDVLAHSVACGNPEKVSRSIDSGMQMIIAPCLDVKKEQLYFSFYEVCAGSDSISGTDFVARITSKDKPYMVRRLTEGHVVEAEDFCSSFLNILEKIAIKKERYIILGGNCLERYVKLLSGFAARYNILLDRKNIFPGPGSLDACVRQSIKNGITTENINPVYAREFVPFGS